MAPTQSKEKRQKESVVKDSSGTHKSSLAAAKESKLPSNISDKLRDASELETKISNTIDEAQIEKYQGQINGINQQIKIVPSPPKPDRMDLKDVNEDLEELKQRHQREQSVVPEGPETRQPPSPSDGNSSEPEEEAEEEMQEDGEEQQGDSERENDGIIPSIEHPEDSPNENPSNMSVNQISDDPEDMWSPGMNRNSKNENVQVHYYKIMGRSSYRLLTERGPQNARSYRMERENDVDVYFNIKECQDLVDSRNGDRKTEDKRWVFSKVHARAIQGVAPFVDGKKFSFDTPWEEIRELLKPKAPKSKVRPVEVQVLVKWQINGVTKKSWETRTTIRRLWGHDKGDKAIHDAFDFQESRYQQYMIGERPPKARSATPWNNGFAPSPSPKPESSEDRLKIPSPFTHFDKAPVTSLPIPTTNAPVSSDIEKLKVEYCKEKLDNKSPAEMSILEQMAFDMWYKKFT